MLQYAVRNQESKSSSNCFVVSISSSAVKVAHLSARSVLLTNFCGTVVTVSVSFVSLLFVLNLILFRLLMNEAWALMSAAIWALMKLLKRSNWAWVNWTVVINVNKAS